MTKEQVNNLKKGDKFTLNGGSIYTVISSGVYNINVISKDGINLCLSKSSIGISGKLVSLKEQFFKNENILVTRDYHIYVVCGNKLLGLNGYMNVCDYDDNMYCVDGTSNKDFDIVQVYKVDGWGIGLKDALNLKFSNHADSLWKREDEIVTMSIADIEKKLNLKQGALRISGSYE